MALSLHDGASEDQHEASQQGEKSKMKPQMVQPKGARELNDPLVWD